MNNILDISLVILVIFVIFMFINHRKSEDFSDGTNNLDCDLETTLENEYDIDPTKYIDAILKSKKKPKVNKFFQEVQFHQDYRDTMNAFNLLTDQKPFFNTADLPVTNVEKPSNTEIKNLISRFIREVNKTVKNHISNESGTNGWADNMPQKKFKSGWDKQQEELGLPGSIYTEPAPKASIKLIKLDHAEKYETDSEVKYVVFLVVQKRNTEDQMLVRVSFVVDKQDMNLDREFFDKKKNTYETAVSIEEISIIGFMITHGFGEQSSREKFYDFDGITDGRMFSQKEIIRQLNKKRRIYEKEYVQH